MCKILILSVIRLHVQVNYPYQLHKTAIIYVSVAVPLLITPKGFQFLHRLVLRGAFTLMEPEVPSGSTDSADMWALFSEHGSLACTLHTQTKQSERVGLNKSKYKAFL